MYQIATPITSLGLFNITPLSVHLYSKTSQNINKTLRKINTTPEGPLQGNSMDAISKK